LNALTSPPYFPRLARHSLRIIVLFASFFLVPRAPHRLPVAADEAREREQMSKGESSGFRVGDQRAGMARRRMRRTRRRSG
jgi:hypothetical protein